MKWEAFALVASLTLPPIVDDSYEYADRVVFATRTVEQPKRAFQGQWSQTTRTIIVQRRSFMRWTAAHTITLGEGDDFPPVERNGPYRRFWLIECEHPVSRLYRYQTRQIVRTTKVVRLRAEPT